VTQDDNTRRRIDVFVQRNPTAEAKKKRFDLKDLSAAFSGVSELVKALGVLVVLLLIVANWSYFTRWLDAITHFEGPGIKFDRAAVAQKIHDISLSRPIDVRLAQGALVRAEIVWPALRNAQLLWVDGTPSNNVLERGILQDMGITVQLAPTTMAALDLARLAPFDLVISNMVRTNDVSVPLQRCHAAYFAFPSDNLSREYDNDLTRFNAQLQIQPPAGFAMAEKFADAFPDLFGNTQVSRIIFYTAASGGIAASACSRIVTNRPDVLLQSVVSALEELRWEKLAQSREQRSTALQ
jgi:hypothetical protein